MEDCTIEEIVELVKGDKFASSIQKIRAAIKKGEKETAQRLKKNLLAFTPSASFKGGRKIEFLESYNPLIVLDIDNIPGGIITYLTKAKVERFTKVCFVSPSGNGLKILVETDAKIDSHILAFRTIANYYENKLGIPIDQSGKDITRLCFFSHDPQIYYNPDSKIFSVETRRKESIETLPAFEECVAFTKQKSTYVNGNRNNFLYLLASNCNRAGLQESDTLTQILTSYDLSPDEIRQSVASAYKHRTYESKNLKIDVPIKSTTPCMPHKIFQSLPVLLREGCVTFKDKRERDVFLTGALTVLSGCLPNVSGVYDRRTNHPNLFSFIIAPAASGKGALLFAKELGFAYHQKLVKESKEHQKDYRKDLQRYELSILRYRKGKLPDPPQKPEEKNFRLLYIPANSSSAMLIRHLQQNGGTGMLFETEADTLGNVLKQDWGGYSDLLRKSFHHEPIAYSRKVNNDFLEIENPRLSVALSGTPNQVIKLIPSVEDGLFSRFLFYVFEVDATWRDVSPQNKNSNIGAFYKTLAQEVVQLVSFLEKYPTNFTLKKEQWQKMNDHFSDCLNKTKTLVGSEALSIVKRLGLILFRIAMILSTCRKYEEQNTAKEISCSDQDFQIAVWMVEVYLEHALYLYHRLPQKSKSTFPKMPSNKRAFFNALPPQFKRKEALVIGKELNLSSATIDRFLKQLSGTILQQPEYGLYQKLTDDKPKT